MNLLRSPLAWIIVAVVVMGVVFLAINARRSKPWGFKDLVKNPREYRDRFESSNEDSEREVREAQSWSPQQVAAHVNRFVFDAERTQEGPMAREPLLNLGEKTHLAVIALLKDSQLRSRLFESNEALFAETPFDRACRLFGQTPPPEAIPAVSPFLDSDKKEVRKIAALVLGGTGRPEAVPFLRRAFADADEYVRSYALMGLGRAIENKRLAPECASLLFGDVQRLIFEGKNADKAAEILLVFDREQAVSFFISETFFFADSSALHEAIEAMNNADLQVPRTKLLSLIESLKTREIKYPQTYLLGETLRALGNHKSADDKPLLESFLSHREERVAEGAAKGLLATEGLGDFEKRIWDKEQKSGYDSLTLAQRHYSAVLMCDAEVKNGGFSQYFFNSSGDQWKDALSGFDAMGCKELADLLREAIAPFGPSGPSENQEKRNDQLGRIYRKNDAIFDPLEKRYYASKEIIEVRAALYVLKNPDAFR